MYFVVAERKETGSREETHGLHTKEIHGSNTSASSLFLPESPPPSGLGFVAPRTGRNKANDRAVL